MANWWDQLNQSIADTGILQAINPVARDVLPGLGAFEDIIGIDPNSWGPNTFVGGADAAAAAPTSPSPILGRGLAVPQQPGGASLDWSGGFPLTTTTGRRGLIPYSGGPVPSGYRVAQRPPRAPSAGTPGGTYLVPRRSMNPLNPRALMRAERRMSAFTHWVKRHFRIAAHTPKRKKIGGRRRR
jgi:hypothetical protein